MSKFRQNLMEARREYAFRIKTVVPLDEGKMKKLRRILQKYNLRSLDGPKRTILQRNPMDFYDIQHAEVYIIDCVLGQPVSFYVLQQEIRFQLNINEKFVVVRSENSPLEIESERIVAQRELDGMARREGLKPAPLLGVDEIYDEAEDSVPGETYYGNEYNSRFLKNLSIVAATRKPDTYEAPAPLFDYLNIEVSDAPPEQDESDFNADIDNAPKVFPWWTVDPKELEDTTEEPRDISIFGNLDDEQFTFIKRYIDPQTGEIIKSAVTSKSIRGNKDD